MRLEKLLEETNEAYYWIGFIAADGHINDNKRLQITLSDKDYEHLKKLSEFLGVDEPKRFICKVNGKQYNHCSINKQDELITKFANKFNIVSDKTHNPIILPNISNDLFMSYFAGYLDGDGCIGKLQNRNDFHIRFRIHNSWAKTLQEYSTRISNILNFEKYNVSISNDGYAILCISKSEICQRIKKKVLQLDIPLLMRKWDIIDLDYIDMYSKAKNTRMLVKQMLKDGIRRTKICEQLKISQSLITKILKEDS